MSTPVASTVTKVVTKVVTSATASSTVRAAPQGGILEGGNPSVYSPTNPLIIFIIQAGIIIIFCRLLHHVLAKLHQPRVIAEVIGGILLGPSVMGHIPGFTNAIFPPAAMPNLTLVANLGLVLFLFLVGLEVDLRFLAGNWKPAISVGALGMALPFGLGFAIAYGLYNQFRLESGLVPIAFGTYMLFIGVAMAITAFPVLCRILTELKLLQTPVGIIVLSAGVSNDVVGWILLALCVALVNAASGLTALYVLLTCLGYALVLVFAVRPAFLWYLRRTGSLENGPSQSVVAFTLLMALTSAFFTGIIGIHPIFGAFMIGLICPHEGGFAIKITEKLEDVVTALFLPLYFALSGLSTNLGLLNNGITWAYVIGVICVAFFAKVIGGTLAARFNGLVWRESLTIGVLMSCKGLVELIVLNIGLQAKILSTRTFTIFVLMALVTTFATTPLTRLLYPRWYQIKLEAWKRGEIEWDDNRLNDEESSSRGDSVSFSKVQSSEVTKLVTYLRADSMPSVLTIVSLLAKNTLAAISPKVHPSKRDEKSFEAGASAQSASKRPFQVHGIRFVELTDRLTSVMKVSEMDDYTSRDPIVNTFKTFGYLNQIAVAGDVVVAPESDYALSLKDKASEVLAELVLIPWSGSGSMNDQPLLSDSADSRFANSTYSQFVNSALKNAVCNVAVFVDQGFGGSKKVNPNRRPSMMKRTISAVTLQDLNASTTPVMNQGHHVFFPYFGSEDDKVALRFVLQLAMNPNVTATIVHFKMSESTMGEITPASDPYDPRASFSAVTDSKNPIVTTSGPPSHYATFFTSLRDSLPSQLASRVVFETHLSNSPLNDTMEHAKREVGVNAKNAGDLIVLGRNSSLSAALSGDIHETTAPIGSEAKSALGVVAEGAIRNGLSVSVLVMKAASLSYGA